MKEKIDDLLREGADLTFTNNSYTNDNGTYGQMSSDFHAWHAKVEYLISSKFDKESSTYKLLKTCNLNSINGYFSDNFYRQHEIIIGALKAAKAIWSMGDFSNSLSPEIDKTKVFIVHGQDDAAKVQVARYIEKLGFEAIILHEQVSSGMTIIEKIEAHSNVGFGIVLYTPCDIGGKDESHLNARARQNVVFEHGYLIGKIGRSNVCALVKGDVETPNDISDVVYIMMNESDGWHLPVARELRSSGYLIDMNRL